jgi:hypothetical protein
MKGYKASYDQRCLGMHYEVGNTYEMQDKPIRCQKGFHFCQKPDDVLIYYRIWERNFVLFEINAIGDIDTWYDKSCTNKIEIVRIIPKEEYNSVFEENKFEWWENGQLKYLDDEYGLRYEYSIDGYYLGRVD